MLTQSLVQLPGMADAPKTVEARRVGKAQVGFLEAAVFMQDDSKEQKRGLQRVQVSRKRDLDGCCFGV